MAGQRSHSACLSSNPHEYLLARWPAGTGSVGEAQKHEPVTPAAVLQAHDHLSLDKGQS